MSRGFKPTTMTQKKKLLVAGSIQANKAQARRRRAASKRRQATVTMLRQIGEKKGVDTVLTLNPVIPTTNTNGSIFVANLVSPGTGSYNRVGRKIHLQSLRIRAIAQHQAAFDGTTANIESNTLRMAIVWDKQPSGTTPQFDDIFGYTLQNGTEAAQFTNPIRYDNMDRFQILRDVVIDFSPSATPAPGGTGTENFIVTSASIDEYVNLGGREVVFSGQSSPCTIADISSGGLYIVFRADSQVNGVNNILISSESFCRLRYTD